MNKLSGGMEINFKNQTETSVGRSGGGAFEIIIHRKEAAP